MDYPTFGLQNESNAKCSNGVRGDQVLVSSNGSGGLVHRCMIVNEA